MSGHKKATINISQEEFDRLRKLELENIYFYAPDNLDTASSYEEVKELFSQFDTLQRDKELEFVKIIERLDTEVKELEYQTFYALKDYQHKTIEGLLDAADQSKMVADSVDNELLILGHKIDEEHENFIHKFSQITEKNNKLIDDDAKKKNWAAEWIINAQTILDFIHTNYDHQFFLPGKYDELLQSIGYSKENYTFGLYESVITNAQKVFQEANSFKSNLENLQINYLAVFQSAYHGLQTLLNSIISNPMVYAVDLDGNVQEEKIDINFWSQGSYVELQNQVQSYLDHLQQGSSQIPFGELIHIVDEILPSFDSRIKEIIKEAQLSVINSQLRVNIADIIIQSLSTQGYTLDKSGYTNNNMSDNFSAKLLNIDGNEITIDICPNYSVPLQNDFHLFTLHPEFYTEHEILMRSNEICRSLEYFGLNISSISIDNDLNHEAPFSNPTRLHEMKKTKYG
jgi:hypothetical protein